MKKIYGNKLNYKFLFMIIIFFRKILKHILCCQYIAMFSNEIMPKICPKYYCEKCDYGTSKKSSFDNHINSNKHKKSTKINENMPLCCPKYACEICDKEYKDRSGLWRHSKICKINYDNNNNEKSTELSNKDEIIMFLIKENSDFKKMMMEQQNMMFKIMEKGTTNNSDSHDTTTHTNSHNKAFNLQFYLNETCKNAMNLSEFIDSIHPQLSDLISVGELGYVEGMSKIIIDNLNKLDFTERPINCTDKKRDVVYVKDDDKWEKDEEYKKLNSAVKRVAYKNTRLFPKFKEKYPDYNNGNSKQSDKYSNIVIQSLDDSRENNEKVIKNISKVTTIKEK